MLTCIFVFLSGATSGYESAVRLCFRVGLLIERSSVLSLGQIFPFISIREIFHSYLESGERRVN